MPNHTESLIVITGPVKDLKEFSKTLYVESDPSDKAISLKEDLNTIELTFDFNKYVPAPPELNSVNSPPTIVSQEEYDAYFRNPPPGTGPITKAMQKEYIKKYGVDNWYDWNIKYWGTKWNAYDQTIELKFQENRPKIKIFLSTAWSPATPVTLKMSERYPTLTIKYAFLDEGGSYCGVEYYKNGKKIKDICIDNFSNIRRHLK